MVSALDSGSSVWVRALAMGIVLWSWVKHLTVTVPLSLSLSTQVNKWVPAIGSIPSRGGGSRFVQFETQLRASHTTTCQS